MTRLGCYLSNEKIPGCWGYIGDVMFPSYVGIYFLKSFLMLKRQWKRIFQKVPFRSFLRPERNGELGRNCAPWTGILVWNFSSLSLLSSSDWRSQWPAFFCVLNCATVGKPMEFSFLEYCFWDTRFQEVAKKEYCALIDNLVPGWRRDAQLEWGVHSHWWWPTESSQSISAPFEGMLQGRSKKQRRTEEGMYNDNLTVTGTVQD